MALLILNLPLEFGSGTAVCTIKFVHKFYSPPTVLMVLKVLIRHNKITVTWMYMSGCLCRKAFCYNLTFLLFLVFFKGHSLKVSLEQNVLLNQPTETIEKGSVHRKIHKVPNNLVLIPKKNIKIIEFYVKHSVQLVRYG